MEEHRAPLAEPHPAQGTAKSPPNLPPAPTWKTSTETARAGVQVLPARTDLSSGTLQLQLSSSIFCTLNPSVPPVPLWGRSRGTRPPASHLAGRPGQIFPFSPLKYLEVAHLVFRQHLKSKERKREFQLRCLPAPRPDKQNLQNKPFSCYKNRALPCPRASSKVLIGCRGNRGQGELGKVSGHSGPVSGVAALSCLTAGEGSCALLSFIC